MGPVLILCLCSSAVLSWGPRWPRWHQGVFLRPGPEGAAPQCESLVRLDAWLPRHLEPSTHIFGSALAVSWLACSFCTVTVVYCVPLPHHLTHLVLSLCLLPSNHHSFLISSSFEPWFFRSLSTFLVSDVLGYFGPFPSPFLSLDHSSFLLFHSSLSCSLSLFLLSHPHLIVFMLTIFTADAWGLDICWSMWETLPLSLFLSFVNWSHFCWLPSVLSVFTFFCGI